jgi:two-component system phosphate regulon response regulator OmpR
MSFKPHVLVCDDETDVREMVAKYLQKRDFDVTMAFDGPSLDEQMTSTSAFDLVLLDINMPGEDGLSILRRLRAEQKLPIIMLTAAGEPVDKVIGLEMGADDYLAKPIDLRELEARIKAVLRRSGQSDVVEVDSIDNAERVAIAGMVLDLSSTTLYGRDGKEVPLTSMEYTLLKLFIKNKGRVLNRDQLMEMASDRDWDPFDRSIDIRVLRLRKKLEVNPKKPTIIRTVRGLGYVFDPKDT